MSISRGEFLRSLNGIAEAIALEPLAQGATRTLVPPGLFVLRRGILIASLIALETFVRDRTAEALRALERWPKSFEDLPERLRTAARFNALTNLYNFAKLLKRNNEDYEAELREEISKMASGQGTVQQFSKFVAGDYTGNISDASLKDLLSCFQVNDCWNSFRYFAADVGIGIPSVQEVVKDTIRKRHRSAHSASYTPTVTDISDLRSDLLCIAICFDVSVSSSMEQALAFSSEWASGERNWRDGVNLFIGRPAPAGLRLIKHGTRRALRVVADTAEAKSRIPRAKAGEIAVFVLQDAASRPVTWDIM